MKNFAHKNECTFSCFIFSLSLFHFGWESIKRPFVGDVYFSFVKFEGSTIDGLVWHCHICSVLQIGKNIKYHLEIDWQSGFEFGNDILRHDWPIWVIDYNQNSLWNCYLLMSVSILWVAWRFFSPITFIKAFAIIKNQMKSSIRLLAGWLAGWLGRFIWESNATVKQFSKTKQTKMCGLKSRTTIIGWAGLNDNEWKNKNARECKTWKPLFSTSYDFPM